MLLGIAVVIIFEFQIYFVMSKILASIIATILFTIFLFGKSHNSIELAESKGVVYTVDLVN
ncbi:hypothetical protein BH09BAC5_BH09BAC5_28770 [soil metagenome]